MNQEVIPEDKNNKYEEYIKKELKVNTYCGKER